MRPVQRCGGLCGGFEERGTFEDELGLGEDTMKEMQLGGYKRRRMTIASPASYVNAIKTLI